MSHWSQRPCVLYWRLSDFWMGHIVTTTMPTPARKITPTLHKCISTNCLMNLIQIWNFRLGIWLIPSTKYDEWKTSGSTMPKIKICTFNILGSFSKKGYSFNDSNYNCFWVAHLCFYSRPYGTKNRQKLLTFGQIALY